MAGFACDEFPAFFSRTSGCAVPARVDDAQQAAALIHSGLRLDLGSGTLIGGSLGQTESLGPGCLQPQGSYAGPCWPAKCAVATQLAAARAQRPPGHIQLPAVVDPAGLACSARLQQPVSEAVHNLMWQPLSPDAWVTAPARQACCCVSRATPDAGRPCRYQRQPLAQALHGMLARLASWPAAVGARQAGA